MDDDDDIFAGVAEPSEESGSEFQNSESDRIPARGRPRKLKRDISSRPGSRKSRGGRIAESSLANRTLSSNPSSDLTSDADLETLLDLKDAESRKEAQKQAAIWASSFKAPTTADEIGSPARRSTTRKKRLGPSKIDRKRLAQFHNSQYRDLLNIDINETLLRSTVADEYSLSGSQIGSSAWNPSEKNHFFTALSLLGRDNVREIANRIKTKSEPQVQEYMQLLEKEKALLGRHQEDEIKLVDVPSAYELSSECCQLLEKAADALAARQESHEVGVEKKKWGDSWLLTEDVSRWLDKRRNQDGGELALEEVLPAANLLNLRNWLELSNHVFMTSSDENKHWQSFATTGQTPAIRATAFEDFHSLVVHITKRLVSTTFYCTMSRERATNSQKVKHAEVTPGDVESAIDILKMAHNSNNFWTTCARRCQLQVVDEVDQEHILTYSEVEARLDFTSNRRSRSRSRSTSQASVWLDSRRGSSSVQSTEADFYSADEAPFSDEPNHDLPPLPRPKRTALSRAETIHSYHEALDQYTEAYDIEESKLEELRLWKMMKQKPPHKIIPAAVGELPKKSKRTLRDMKDEQREWRNWVGYGNEWEAFQEPIREEMFTRKRKRRRTREESTRRLHVIEDLVDEEDLQDVDEADLGAEDEDFINADERSIHETLIKEEEFSEEDEDFQLPSALLSKDNHRLNWSSDDGPEQQPSQQIPSPKAPLNWSSDDEPRKGTFQALPTRLRSSFDVDMPEPGPTSWSADEDERSMDKDLNTDDSPRLEKIRETTFRDSRSVFGDAMSIVEDSD